MVSSVGGFAFNGPDSLAMSSLSDAGDLAQDLVTKRVNTFSDARRSEPTRYSSPPTAFDGAAERGEPKATAAQPASAEDAYQS